MRPGWIAERSEGPHAIVISKDYGMSLKHERFILPAIVNPASAIPKYSTVAPISGTVEVMEIKSTLTCEPALI